MANNKALVRLYILQLQQTSQLLALSKKIDYVLQACGVNESSILEISEQSQKIVEKITKSQIEHWKDFLEMLYDGDDLSSLSIDDLLK